MHHDLTLDRTTDRRGEVASFTADELGRIDAGYRLGRGEAWPFHGSGAGVPTLAAVLSWNRDRRVIVKLKIKSVELGTWTRSSVIAPT